MQIIASTNGAIGFPDALNALTASGSLRDAIEAAIRPVEANPNDNTVGYNGFPNILGEHELDASIMDGATLESGAVAGLTNTVHAITVARHVMEKLPHVLLCGAGATRFAREMGVPPTAPMMETAVLERYNRQLDLAVPDSERETLASSPNLHHYVKTATDPEKAWSTVNVILRDDAGNICAGVSTSGWAWKYPGRVGDSPLIGAGIYADNRYGACTCTGMGEMAIRANTAHTVVLYMKMGMGVREAARQAMVDLRDLGGDYIGVMNLIAMDAEGNHVGFTSKKGRTYVYQTHEMETYAEVEREFVEILERWKTNE